MILNWRFVQKKFWLYDVGPDRHDQVLDGPT